MWRCGTESATPKDHWDVQETESRCCGRIRAGEVEEGAGPCSCPALWERFGVLLECGENVEHSKQVGLVHALECSLCFMEDALWSVLVVWEPHRRLLDCTGDGPSKVLDAQGERSALEERTGESFASKR